jgi:hypothetical protein
MMHFQHIAPNAVKVQDIRSVESFRAFQPHAHRFGFDSLVYRNCTGAVSKYDFTGYSGIFVSDIFAECGMQWWIDNGISFTASFSLHEGPRSMQTLKTYCGSKGRTL